MRILSGIQPTGEIHLGNYLGSIKQWKKLQEDKNNQCLFFIADYHSLTANLISGREKRKQIIQLAIDLIALGLDPQKSILTIQSQIPEVLELAWIFNCLTPMGELERMTQFKDKAARQKENINAGLFTYPALMAADILLYHTEAVPVGQDQLQHLELTRETARRFNRQYGKYFKEPKEIFSSIPKLMSLKDPLQKMSKSDASSYIGVFDSPDEIRKKIKSAVTADNRLFKEIKFSGSGFKFVFGHKEGEILSVEKERMVRGLENLLVLLKEFDSDKFNGIFDIKEEGLDSRFRGNDEKEKAADLEKLRYGEIKEELAKSIIKYFEPMRKKREELMKNKEKVMKIYEKGSQKARIIAQKTIEEVKSLVGLP